MVKIKIIPFFELDKIKQKSKPFPACFNRGIMVFIKKPKKLVSKKGGVFMSINKNTCIIPP